MEEIVPGVQGGEQVLKARDGIARRAGQLIHPRVEGSRILDPQDGVGSKSGHDGYREEGIGGQGGVALQ